MGYSPLVYAYEQHDVAITGKGTLDGQADAEHWWPWKRNGHPQSQKPDRDRLFAQAEAGVPVAERVFGAGHYLRPQFVQPYRCTNVLVEGVTITNAPMWVIHPVLSRNVIVRGRDASSPRAPTTTAATPSPRPTSSSRTPSSTPATTASPSSRAATPTGGGSPPPPSGSW